MLETERRSRHAWRTPVLLGAVAVALRVGAVVVHRHLSLDDGAYGISTVDMRHGLAPYRDLFSSQGPLHYPLLALGDMLGLHARNAPRVVPFLSGVFTPIGVWALARRLGASPRMAVVAGLLIATTGSLLWVTAPVSADGPAIAFTVGALWAAAVERDEPARWRVVLAGALFGAALATKPLVFPAVIPLVWWLWARRRRVSDLVLAGGSAVTVWFLAAVPWGLGRVWDQSIRFHLEKQGQSPPWTQFGKLVTTLVNRDLVLVALVAVTLAAMWITRRAIERPHHADVVVISTWAVVVAIVLVFEKLLLVSHVATLIVPLTLLVALRPPPWNWLLLAIACTLPIQAYQLSDIVWPQPYDAQTADVVAQIRALPPGALAISDIGGLVWQAGRHTPAMLNDNSNARISTGHETTRTVLDAASRPDVCAVAIWSFRWSDELPGLREGLRDAGYTLARDFAPDRQLWLKPSCAPGDRASAAAAPGRSRG